MASRWISLILVAALGTLIAHQAAYGLSAFATPAAGAPDHGYLAIAAQLVVPAGIGAFMLVVLRAARQRLDLTGITVLTLTLVQIGLFLTQETIEWAVSGGGSGLIGNPAVWIGVAIQPLIAAVDPGSGPVGSRTAVRQLRTATSRRPTRRTLPANPLPSSSPTSASPSATASARVPPRPTRSHLTSPRRNRPASFSDLRRTSTMNMNARRITLPVLLLAFALVATACSSDDSGGGCNDIDVENAWLRLPPGENTALYFDVSNGGGSRHRLGERVIRHRRHVRSCTRPRWSKARWR